MEGSLECYRTLCRGGCVNIIVTRSRSSNAPLPPQAINNDQPLRRINGRWTIFNGFLLYKLRLYALTSKSNDYCKKSFGESEVSVRKRWYKKFHNLLSVKITKTKHFLLFTMYCYHLEGCLMFYLFPKGIWVVSR